MPNTKRQKSCYSNDDHKLVTLLGMLGIYFSFYQFPHYLRLRQAQFGCQVGPLRQGKVLSLLEALVERLELQAGVDGPRLPDLLPFPVQPHLPVLDDCRGLLVI